MTWKMLAAARPRLMSDRNGHCSSTLATSSSMATVPSGMSAMVACNRISSGCPWPVGDTIPALRAYRHRQEATPEQQAPAKQPTDWLHHDAATVRVCKLTANRQGQLAGIVSRHRYRLCTPQCWLRLAWAVHTGGQTPSQEAYSWLSGAAKSASFADSAGRAANPPECTMGKAAGSQAVHTSMLAASGLGNACRWPDSISGGVKSVTRSSAKSGKVQRQCWHLLRLCAPRCWLRLAWAVHAGGRTPSREA